MIKNQINEEQQFTPDFFMIPGEVMLDPELQALDAKVFGVIYWMERLKEGKCFASNQAIANTIKSTPSSVRQSIYRLIDRGYVLAEYDERNNRKELKCNIPSPLRKEGVATATGGVSPQRHRERNTKRENNYGYRKDVTEENYRAIARILKDSEKSRFLDERKRKFNARLAEYTLDEILAAARNLSKSAFHMGDNPDKKKYANFDFLMRNDSQIDKWLNIGDDQPAPGWSFQNNKRKDGEQ